MDNRLPRTSVVRWAAPLITLLAAITAGTLYGVQPAVLTLAAAALLLVIWLLWSSVQALAGESQLTFEEAFSLGARSAEEEQKRAVLRALKDLEYERSVGKISEEDYHEYSARYRAEAKRLIQSLDENLAEGRKRVEQELARRLAKREDKSSNGDASPEELPSTAPDISEDPPESVPVETESTAPKTRACSACEARNELDARFCKACGKALAAEEATS